MKNHVIKTSNVLNKKRHTHLNDDELFCKKYSNDSLLQLLHFSYREITILKLRWNDSRAFDDIAYQLGLSQERVRVIYRKIIKKIISNLKNKESQESSKVVIDTNELASHIENIEEFKTKWVNILKERNIITVQELAKHNRKELLLLKSFGKTTIDAIEIILKKYGYELAA